MNKARDHLSKKRSIKGYAKLAESNKLLQLLGEIPDHRKGQGKRHRLDHILYLSILAELMGAIDYKQISIWIARFIQEEEIKKLLGVEFILTPSRSVVSDVLAKVNSEKLETVFREWINQHIETNDKRTHTPTHTPCRSISTFVI